MPNAMNWDTEILTYFNSPKTFIGWCVNVVFSAVTWPSYYIGRTRMVMLLQRYSKKYQKCWGSAASGVVLTLAFLIFSSFLLSHCNRCSRQWHKYTLGVILTIHNQQYVLKQYRNQGRSYMAILVHEATPCPSSTDDAPRPTDPSVNQCVVLFLRYFIQQLQFDHS